MIVGVCLVSIPFFALFGFARSGAPVSPNQLLSRIIHPTATDTVQISSAAKAALQEATETAVQTAKEARSGDLQAQRLLAREAASAEEANESPAAKAQEAQSTSAGNLR